MSRSGRLPERIAAALLAFVLTGCGYPGEPLPPALKRPVRIVDLNAVERGSKIVIQFTIPAITTEGVPVKGAERLDVRIGPAPPGKFDMNAWARSAERIPEDQIRRNPPIALIELSAARFYNRRVIIAARALSPKGSDAGWSNVLDFRIVPALPQPAAVEWKDAPDAVELAWHAAAPSFRVLRRITGGAEWNLLATVNKAEYLDNTIEYGRTYDYDFQSIEKTDNDQFAESDLTELDGVKPVDKFPPAVPTGLDAVPSTKSIELVWNRNTEKDFAGYRLYRDGKLLAGNLVSLAYSDRDVKPGATYSYQISAVDKAGNESARSAAASAALP